MGMSGWPDRRILDLFGIEVPILQAPMAGASTPEMAIAVNEAGGLGSLPCALLSPDQARTALDKIRGNSRRPINLNFFCHTPPVADPAKDLAWRARLAPYYMEEGLDPETPVTASARAPFDDAYCRIVEEYKPEVASFHFGLPEKTLLERVRKTGAKIVSSATTVAEARWLEERGCDAIIAMGAEAGGHRGLFLTEDVLDVTTQVGLFALLPQVVDAVKVPVIAAGGIADARGIVAAFALGAAAVQIGTAYLLSPEAKILPAHREALANARDDNTAMTNLFTGRPARGIVNRLMRELGAINRDAPPFPLAGGALAPLRAKTESVASSDFINLWSGQAARYAKALPAAEITRQLAAEALAKLK
jgi:nitronate monooxygenase